MAALHKAWCQCCVTGGGPAGIMLGLLLARAGLDVIVLEQHADLRRGGGDLRRGGGDTIHASTQKLIGELGVLPQSLQREIHDLRCDFGATPLRVADFGHRSGFIALRPQGDFVEVLAERAHAYPTFKLHMATAATGLIEERGRIRGLHARGADGELEIHADLCVAADGRHSTLRALAGMQPRELGAPIDVLWFELARPADAGSLPQAHFGAGQSLITIDRGSTWQCAYVIARDGYPALRARGLEAFRARIADLVPALAASVAGLADWDQALLLTVQIDRLERWWRPGLLCIGGAAHAMSPIAGGGVDLAIQDAVATANVLANPLLDAALEDRHLAAVQRRRQLPAHITQRLQLLVQDKLGAPGGQATRPPLSLRLLDRLPPLRRLAGRLIAMGVRPEHIRTPDVGTS